MRQLSLPPTTKDFENKSPFLNDWFKTVYDRFNAYEGASDPVAAEVPLNQWIVYHNTTSGEVRVWINIAGVLKKSAAFT